MITIKIAFYIWAATVLFFTTLCQQQQRRRSCLYFVDKSSWLHLLHAHMYRHSADSVGQDPSRLSRRSSYFMQDWAEAQGPPSTSGPCELEFPAGKHTALSQDWAIAHCAVTRPVSEWFPDSSSNFKLFGIMPFPWGNDAVCAWERLFSMSNKINFKRFLLNPQKTTAWNLSWNSFLPPLQVSLIFKHLY